MIIIRVFYPLFEPETALKYLEGHRRVLNDYGIENITTNNEDWITNPGVFGVVAMTETGEMLGGVRTHIADRVTPLPLEEAIGKMDSKIYAQVNNFCLNGGAGELCGLWNSKTVAGKGISTLLTRAGVSIINQLHFKTLLGICADYTLAMFTRIGFVVDKTLGVDGNFIYPTPEYLAKVLGILNVETLETSAPYDKERMLNLRANPNQIMTEENPKGNLVVKYELTISLEILKNLIKE
jgi:hypothetical protein